MGDKKCSKKKRSLMPPPVPSELETKTDAEITGKLKDFDDCNEDMRRRIKAALRPEIRGKLDNGYQKDYFKSLAECAINREEKLMNDLIIANSKLNLRPTVEVRKESIVPTWLLSQTQLREEMKLAVALHFKLTKEAKILCDRDVRANGEPSDVVDVAKTFVDLEDGCSVNVAHNKYASLEDLSEEQWKEVFEVVKFRNPLFQDIAKNLLKPIPLDEFQQKYNKKEYYYLYVNNLNIDCGSEETDETIRQYCEQFSDQLHGLYYLVDLRDNTYTGEVYLQLTISKDDVETLKGLLAKHPKPKAKVFCKSHRWRN